MNAFSSNAEREPRRGELEQILSPHARTELRVICSELQELQRRADMIDDVYLAELICAAAEEARDQLRDDLVLREAEHAKPAEA
jgi:hypothetical protein